jgi:hypothetical protein
MWMGWVIATFLMEKGKRRNWIVLILLPAIIGSGFSIPFSHGYINVAFIYFVCIGFIHIVRNSKDLLYYLLSSFLTATIYIALQLFALYDPVKLIIDKKFMLIIVISTVLILICKTQIDLFCIPLISIFIGDTVYQFLIYKLNGFVEIGSLYVLDLLASTSIILLFMVVLVDMFKKMRRITFKKHNSVKQI